jgi:RNA 2',3'-cyclic 3'-phosphodiesterase
MRTFIAIPLPEECRRVLQQIQNEMRASEAEVRWVNIPSIHLTLKFLGEVDPSMLPNLIQELRLASNDIPPFALKVGGVGAFPNSRNPRVVWCGVSAENDRLSLLQEVIEQACEKLGFAREDRSFSPHLTLGRAQGKRNLQRLCDYIRIGRSELQCDITVDAYNVYKSTLAPKGAIYNVLERIALNPEVTGS